MPAVIVGEKGRYAIGASLGSGGMASVHRGVEIKTRRPVAIKRLHPHLVTNAWVASRFREEATLARRLDHPNVAKVLDLAETSDGPALVLELYEGGSLLALSYASWNRGDPLAQGVASAVVLDVLAALTAAHGLTKDGAPAPVVHRDVSPHNVLFGRDGVAHLADETEIAVDEPPPSSLLETTRHPRRRASRRWGGSLAIGAGALLMLAAGGLGVSRWRVSTAAPESSAVLASELVTTSPEEAFAPPSSEPPFPSTAVESAPTTAPSANVSSTPARLASVGPRSSASPALAPTSLGAVTTSSFIYEQPPTPPPAPSSADTSGGVRSRTFDEEQGKAQLAFVMAKASCPANGVLFMRVTIFPDGVVLGVSGAGSDDDGCVDSNFHSRFSSTAPFKGEAFTFTVGTN